MVGRSFSYIEKQIRKKTFGVLGTVSPKWWAHTSGILYGVSSPESSFEIYVMIDKSFKKVRNIKNNPQVSFLIPYPHYYLRMIPSSTVQFQGIAEFIYKKSPTPSFFIIWVNENKEEYLYFLLHEIHHIVNIYCRHLEIHDEEFEAYLFEDICKQLKLFKQKTSKDKK